MALPPTFSEDALILLSLRIDVHRDPGNLQKGAMHLRIEREAMFESGLYPFTRQFYNHDRIVPERKRLRKVLLRSRSLRNRLVRERGSGGERDVRISRAEWRPQSRSQDCFPLANVLRA